MQKFTLFLALSFATIAAFSCKDTKIKEETEYTVATSSNDSSTKKFAELQLIEDFFDFGSLEQGEVVSTTFRFKNIGNIPLIINHVIPSCGCTKTKISKEILKPNEEAYLEITFESAGWRGLQYKDVSLKSNDSISEKSVTIRANVIVK